MPELLGLGPVKLPQAPIFEGGAVAAHRPQARRLHAFNAASLRASL